jgi:hypothetical protein
MVATMAVTVWKAMEVAHLHNTFHFPIGFHADYMDSMWIHADYDQLCVDLCGSTWIQVKEKENNNNYLAAVLLCWHQQC